MKVLIACECSQVVLEQFLLLGHDAYSCDVQAAQGGDKYIRSKTFLGIAAAMASQWS